MIFILFSLFCEKYVMPNYLINSCFCLYVISFQNIKMACHTWFSNTHQGPVLVSLACCLSRLMDLKCSTGCVLVSQSCLTLCNPMDCSSPGSSVHGMLQVRILEWVASPSSRDLADPGVQPELLMSPTFSGGFFTTSATWEAPGRQWDLPAKSTGRTPTVWHPQSEPPAWHCPGLISLVEWFSFWRTR